MSSYLKLKILENPPKLTDRVSGIVVDGLGKPVEGAAVEFHSLRELGEDTVKDDVTELVTSGDGCYRGRVKGNFLQLWREVSKDGYQPVVHPPDRIHEHLSVDLSQWTVEGDRLVAPEGWDERFAEQYVVVGGKLRDLGWRKTDDVVVLKEQFVPEMVERLLSLEGEALASALLQVLATSEYSPVFDGISRSTCRSDSRLNGAGKGESSAFPISAPDRPYGRNLS